MHSNYPDIMRLAETAGSTPQWWDENGVPRFCTFTPDHLADIYADEAVLATIACQSCHRTFFVAFSLNAMNRHVGHYGRSVASLYKQIMTGQLHYGDPPNVGCCASGASMNSELETVLEYWRRGDSAGAPPKISSWEWARVTAFEGALIDEETGEPTPAMLEAAARLEPIPPQTVQLH